MDLMLEQNKNNAMAFYARAFNDCQPADAVERYVGNEYVQHNPLVGDGKSAFIDYFIKMGKDWPGKKVRFVRAVAEEDLVALHCYQTWPGDDEYVTMDIFRFDDSGKIVEHWDAVQKIPVTSKNDNTMY